MTQARSKKAIRVNLAARAADAERRRARTRERLLEAAEAVIAEKGVAAASIDELVRQAGVSRGTFYNYFPTATDLLAELNRRVAEGLADRLAGLAHRQVDPATRMAASLHTVMAAYAADPLRGWVALQVATSLAPRAVAFETLFARLYREGVKAGQFHDVDVAAVLTVTFGAMRMARRDAVASGEAAQPVAVVALLLTAFGVPHDQARRLSAEEAAAAQAAS